jgi:hypothetical protein
LNQLRPLDTRGPERSCRRRGEIDLFGWFNTVLPFNGRDFVCNLFKASEDVDDTFVQLEVAIFTVGV